MSRIAGGCACSAMRFRLEGDLIGGDVLLPILPEVRRRIARPNRTTELRSQTDLGLVAEACVAARTHRGLSTLCGPLTSSAYGGSVLDRPIVDEPVQFCSCVPGSG